MARELISFLQIGPIRQTWEQGYRRMVRLEDFETAVEPFLQLTPNHSPDLKY